MEISDSTPNQVLLKPNKYPADCYMTVERITRGDLILNHQLIVGYLSFLEGNLTNDFLFKRITNFEESYRTIVSVSGACLQKTPTKIAERALLGDFFYFTVGVYYGIFTNEEMSEVLVDTGNLENNYQLPWDLERYRRKAAMMVVPWILLLKNKIALQEGPIATDKMIESLISYHMVTEY